MWKVLFGGRPSTARVPSGAEGWWGGRWPRHRVESTGWSGRPSPPSSASSVREDRPSRDELLCRSAILLSRGRAEVLGGLVGVTDGQADGSDVLYGLTVGEKNDIHLYKRFVS